MEPTCSASLEETSLLTFLGVVVRQGPYCVCDKTKKYCYFWAAAVFHHPYLQRIGLRIKDGDGVFLTHILSLRGENIIV